MYQRILFCVPPFPNKYGAPTHPHTGVGYLSEMLNINNIKTSFFDMRLGYKKEKVLEYIEEFKPDLIGVTMMTLYHRLAYELIHFIKNCCDIPVVIGGPHVSTLREKILEECEADFAVILEGEYPLLALCQGKGFSEIPGLIFRDNGRAVSNSVPQLIKNLDSMPHPTYRNCELKKYARKRIPIITSRGCPFECTYCPNGVAIGRGQRMRSAINVFNELSYWYKKGYRDFDFQDDNFTMNKNRVYELCDLMEDNSLKDLQLMCGNGIRADLVNEKILRRMYEVGFRSLAIGVESANTEVLKRCKKGETIEDIENAIEIACDIGYDVTLYFIVGLPGETLETLEDSIKLVYKYPVSAVSFFNLVPFPGTELYEWVEKNNYFNILPKDYLNSIAHWEPIPIFSTPEFTLEERKLALNKVNIVMQDMRKKDMEKKLGNGKLAKLFSFIIYSSYTNKFVVGTIQKFPLIKRLINYIMQRFNLRFYL